MKIYSLNTNLQFFHSQCSEGATGSIIHMFRCYSSVLVFTVIKPGQNACEKPISILCKNWINTNYLFNKF